MWWWGVDQLQHLSWHNRQPKLGGSGIELHGFDVGRVR
jgi:hypothetical protein